MLESLFNKVAGLSLLNRTPLVVTSDLRVTASLNEECALVQVYHVLKTECRRKIHANLDDNNVASQVIPQDCNA